MSMPTSTKILSTISIKKPKYNGVKGTKKQKNELFIKRIERAVAENTSFSAAVKDVIENPNKEPLYLLSKPLRIVGWFQPKICKGAQIFLAVVYIRENGDTAFNYKGEFDFKLFEKCFKAKLNPKDNEYSKWLNEDYFSNTKITKEINKNVVELASRDSEYVYSFSYLSKDTVLQKRDLIKIIGSFLPSEKSIANLSACSSSLFKHLIKDEKNSLFEKKEVGRIKKIEKLKCSQDMSKSATYLLSNNRFLHVIKGGPIRIWNTGAENYEKILTSFARPATNIVFLSAEYFVYVEEYPEKSLKIWNVLTNECKTIAMTGNVAFMHEMLLLPGNRLAISRFNGLIEIWNLDTGSLEKTHSEPSAITPKLSVLPDGRLLMITHENKIRVWNTIHEESAKTFAQYQAKRFQKATILTNNRIAVVASDGIKIWNTETEQCEKTLSHSPKKSDSKLKILPDGRLLIAKSNGLIKIWNTATEDCLEIKTSFKISKDYFLKVLPDGHFLIANPDGLIKIWNTNTGNCKITIQTGPYCDRFDYNSLFLLLPHGRLAKAGYLDGSIKIWNLNIGELEYTLEGYSKEMNAIKTADKMDAFKFELQLLPNGRILSNVSGNITEERFLDCNIKIWEYRHFSARQTNMRINNYSPLIP